MQKVVMSLGGSLIHKGNEKFLRGFKDLLIKKSEKQRFVVVCGGGRIAREQIFLLKKQGKSIKEQAHAGIRATRHNARLMMAIFGKYANKRLPVSIKEIKNHARKNSIVFCGALRYNDRETSDGTAAKIASHLKTQMVNLTNVRGLYDKDPNKNRSARLIRDISWAGFNKIISKIKFKPGQNFILDQSTAKIIEKRKIKTYIIGKDIKNLRNLLEGKRFTGTIIGK